MNGLRLSTLYQRQRKMDVCNCYNRGNELSAFGRTHKHASHYKDCPMYKEPTPEQKENARRMLKGFIS